MLLPHFFLGCATTPVCAPGQGYCEVPRFSYPQYTLGGKELAAARRDPPCALGWLSSSAKNVCGERVETVRAEEMAFVGNGNSKFLVDTHM